MVSDATLYARMELRVADAEKKLAKFQTNVDRNMSSIERRTKRAAGTMESSLGRSVSKIGGSFKSFGLGAVAALAPVLSLSVALSKAKDAISEFDKIAKDAKATGLDTDYYQGIAHGADLAGVGVDQLNQSLIAFVRNAGLAATGKGELVEKLKLLNPQLLTAIQNAKSQAERFDLVADAVKNATSETEKAAIASAAFGKNGARMVELLKNGAAGLDQFAEQAKNLGLIIDRDLLARSEELNDQLSISSRVMSTQFKQALIDLAPILISSAKLAADVAAAIRQIVDAMRDVENKSTRGLEDNLASLGMERVTIENRLLELKDRQRNNTSVIAGAEGKLDFESLGLNDRLSTISGEETRLLAELGRRNNRQEQIIPPSLPLTSASGGGTSSRSNAAKDAVRQAEAVQELIASLEQERAEIGMSDVEREKSQALRRAGSAATDEQKAKIGELIEMIDAETQAQQKATEAAEFFQDTIYGVFQDLVPAIETGNKALDNFVNTLMEASLQATLLGKGPLAGFFGTSGGGLLSGLGGGGGGDPWSGLRNTGASGGLFGGAIIPGILHSGGVAGKDGYGHGRSVSPSVFSGAPRYHNGGIAGLRSGEVPAILERGEMVIPKGSMRSGRNDASQTVNIINQSGSEVREQRRTSANGDQLTEIVIERVKDDMSQGGFDGPLGGRFGARPIKVRRG